MDELSKTLQGTPTNRGVSQQSEAKANSLSSNVPSAPLLDQLLSGREGSTTSNGADTAQKPQDSRLMPPDLDRSGFGGHTDRYTHYFRFWFLCSALRRITYCTIFHAVVSKSFSWVRALKLDWDLVLMADDDLIWSGDCAGAKGLEPCRLTTAEQLSWKPTRVATAGKNTQHWLETGIYDKYHPNSTVFRRPSNLK